MTDDLDTIVAIAAAGRYPGLVGGAYEGAAGFRAKPGGLLPCAGLDPKYFTLWKRKLRGPGVSAETAEPAAIVALRLSLGNVISLSLELATGSIPALVRELAGLRC